MLRLNKILYLLSIIYFIKLSFPGASKNIRVLHDKNYDMTLNIDKSRKFMVFFYSKNNCSDCEDMFKYFNELSNIEVDKEVNKAIINCDDNDSICSRFFITSYPLLIYLHNDYYYSFSKAHGVEEYMHFEKEGYLSEKKEKLLSKPPSKVLKLMRFLKKIIGSIKTIIKGKNKLLKWATILLLSVFLLLNGFFFYYCMSFICCRNKVKLKDN